MARNDLISKLYAKKGTALEFNYDSLMAPPLASLIPLRDLEYMNKLVTSIKYASKIDYKESEIKKVMSCYGFQRYASGTHRVVYRHLDIPNIIAKISLNKSSLGDNIREMQNQYYLKPFCTKVFDVYPTGLIGLFERVEPFQSRDEFMSVAGDIFDFINSKIIGKYVVDDIGTASFMNYGIRKAGPYSDISFGPVILDFTEVFPLDGDKLYCNKVVNGFMCGGVLDYDEGFNTIRCTKCGKIYEARELQKTIANHEVIKKGEATNMKMEVVRNGKVIKSVDSNKMATNTIQPPKKKKEIVTSSQMDMVGNATGRRTRKNTTTTVFTPNFDKYNDSNKETKNIFIGGYTKKQEEVKPEPAEEETTAPLKPEEIPVEPEVTETKYNTDTGFIPPMEEEPKMEAVEPVETEETTEEDENPTVYSSEMDEEAVEPVEPEDELGSESVNPEDELGGDDQDISIDPAAIAASMMGDSNPFVK